MAKSAESPAISTAAFYTCQHPEQYDADWQGFYARALERRRATLAKYTHALNVPYGKSPYHRMDVFMPSSAHGRPVILYFHGGRWREGHPAFYDYFADPWVADGAVFASCGYRLEPATIGDSVDDAVAVVNWWGRHAQEYGGDRRHLVVAGHSAGGHLAAMAALTPYSRNVHPNASVIAALIMSGVTDLTEWGTDPDTAARLSPARCVTVAPRHVVLSYGNPEPNKKGVDGSLLTRQGELLHAALDRAGFPHTTVSLGRMDHVGTAAAFSDPVSALFVACHYAIFGPTSQSQARCVPRSAR